MQTAVRLGQRVRDRVTRLEGVVIALCENLTGCDTVLIHPGINEKGAMQDAYWADYTRCEIVDAASVLDVPAAAKERGSVHLPLP